MEQEILENKWLLVGSAHEEVKDTKSSFGKKLTQWYKQTEGFDVLY